jgi:outer membrane lipoprotein LolB
MIESDSHLATPCSRANAPVEAVSGLRFLPAMAAACVVLWLGACTPLTVRPEANGVDQERGLAAQAARESALSAQPDWSFSGRVALSQGKDGGSGRIEWRQRGNDFDIRLSAPITGQSWRVTGGAGKARLEGLAGGVREGSDAEALLHEATGWRIPVDAMARWVRGARAPGEASLDFDGQLRPGTLHQHGWAVEYRDWEVADPPRPTRVFARQGEASVRLVIDRWTLP